MGDLLYFPVRRVASLGIAPELLDALRAAMPNVAISSEGSALQKCDLLLIAEHEPGSMELIDWLRDKSPSLPVFVARVRHTAEMLVGTCRDILFRDPPASWHDGDAERAVRP